MLCRFWLLGWGWGGLMSRRVLATALNIILPGAGLLYCGQKRLAAINLAAAVLFPAAAWLYGFPAEHVLWLFLAVAAASGGLARAVAGEG
ncbi:MAG: hypothetical protein RLZZ458_303 [Planctomycetota bacterium]